jgi:hypothetical protein
MLSSSADLEVRASEIQRLSQLGGGLINYESRPRNFAMAMISTKFCDFVMDH